MGFLTMNHKEAEGGGLPQPGTYECFIKNMDVNHKSKNKGTPGTEILFSIRDDVEQDHQGGKIYDRLYDAENAMWRYQSLLKAAGIPDGTYFETKAEIKSAVMGKPLKVEIGHREYDGKTQIDVKGFEESDEGGELPPEKQGGGLDDNGPAPEINDDDLPF